MKVNQTAWKRFERFLTAELKYIQENLVNDLWEITIEFSQEPSKSISDEWYADAETDYEYRRHHITFYQKGYRKYWPDKKAELILILLHEYCHMYMTPISDMAAMGQKKNDYVNTLNERTTELIARNFFQFLYQTNGTRQF